jgi:hypothetical protein
VEICDLLGYDATTKWERVKGLEWFYEDADKNIVLRVERRENGEVDEDGKPKKQYWQSRPDDSGGWVYDVKRVEPVPYRLPDLNNALLLNIPIFLAEGEKCVDALLKLGVVATTNAGGAGFWSYKLNKYFKNAVVIFLPDNDEAGRARLKKVGEHLHGIARSLR